MLTLNTIERAMKQVCEDYMKGEDKMKVTRGSLWLGREWEEAIKLSLETPDCGVEEIKEYKYPNLLLDDEEEIVGYQIFGWSNGYRRKYKTRIPKKYNSFVKELLIKEKL